MNIYIYIYIKVIKSHIFFGLVLLGLSRKDLCNVKEFNNELKENLKELIKEREQIVKQFKLSILINFKDFKSYGDSEHVQKLTKLLGRRTRKKIFVNIRDYLMLTLAYINCLRCSNLMNITVKDFNMAKPGKEIKGAYKFTNKHYEVSIIYGAKLLLVPTTHL